MSLGNETVKKKKRCGEMRWGWGKEGKEHQERGQGTVKKGRRKTGAERKGEGGAHGGRAGEPLSALVVTAFCSPSAPCTVAIGGSCHCPLKALLAF